MNIVEQIQDNLIDFTMNFGKEAKYIYLGRAEAKQLSEELSNLGHSKTYLTELRFSDKLVFLVMENHHLGVGV